MFFGGTLRFRPELAGIDKAEYLSGRGRDAGYLILIPNVGPQFVLDEFEFVELVDLVASLFDADTPNDLKGFGIEHANRIGAIAHIEVVPVVGQSPTLTVIIESTNMLQGLSVVHQANSFFPSQLIDLAVQERNAFTEVTGCQSDACQHFTCFQIDAPEGRFAVLAGAFPELSIVSDESLAERIRVVRKAAYN